MDSRKNSSAFFRNLAAAAGSDCLLTEPSDCWPYGYDNSRLQAQPGAVAFASTHSQIQDVIEVCNQAGVPLVCRGSGTGTTGATVPRQHAVVLSFERMQKIIGIDPVNRTATVQPGVTNAALQRESAQHGFFWPPDPTSAEVCTIGGNLAYNSAGPRAVKYGTPRENTLALTAISGDAKSFHTGTLTTKGVVGYDLTRLLIGSEGTLGVITEATLKLTPEAESRRTMRASYRDIHAAARAVAAIMSQPVTPCALEFMDHSALQMVRDFSDLQLDGDIGAMLMIEVDAMEHAIDEAAAQVAAAARVDGCIELRIAASQQEVDQLWKTRKALSPALRNIAPKKINEDVVVPISQLPHLIEGLEQLSLQHRIQIVNFGHAGNGNIHVNLLTNPDDPGETARAEACLSDVFSLVLELQGTLSGEHGVGIVKRDY
ncbi:MAG: FAD-linked oxidase C-terminal domain-containing protein, partial [Pseudomonadota bacterium]|nr:FAD-linked oxidase C-terminal domain-containing protein [Pseudomonadota bacterium]